MFSDVLVKKLAAASEDASADAAADIKICLFMLTK